MEGNKEKTLNAENLHVFGQVKVLSLGKAMNGNWGWGMVGGQEGRWLWVAWNLGRISSLLAVTESEGACASERRAREEGPFGQSLPLLYFSWQ